MKNSKYDSKEYIITKHLDLLSHSRSKPSIQKICEYCFLSRQTFYKYFTGYDDLASQTAAHLLPEQPTPSLPGLVMLIHEQYVTLQIVCATGLDDYISDQILTLIHGILYEKSSVSPFLQKCTVDILMNWIVDSCNLPPQTITALCQKMLLLDKNTL